MIVVLMGVAGSGKTAVGERLATCLDWPFVDADDLHPSGNLRKMAGGEPLSDADRWPWLERVRAVLAEHEAADRSVVAACSALKRSYRDLLRGAGDEVVFVHLCASSSALERRLRERRGHFFDPDLLASQLAALEEPAEGEAVVEVDAEPPLETVVERVAAAVGRAGS